MAVTMMTWLLAIPLLGLATGLRTFTPLAMLCWFARLGYLPVQGTWASWTARTWVMLLFTVLAAGELFGDKFPNTPSRTALAPLIGRLALGGLAGSICATALHGSGLEGVLLGGMSAVLGAFAGFMIRRDLVEKIGCADWPIALTEDLVALLAAFFAMHIITG